MTRVVRPGHLGAFAAKQPRRQFGPTSRSVIHGDSLKEQDGNRPRLFGGGAHANGANRPTRVQRPDSGDEGLWRQMSARFSVVAIQEARKKTMTQLMMDAKLITTAVELACRAPSLHNSQPWRWVASSTSVDLFVDPHRTVTSTDRSGREAIISCGAALDHFRVAMAAVGWDTNVEQFPNPNDLDHLASTDFASVDYVT